MTKSWVRNTVAAAVLAGASSWALGQSLPFEGLKDNEPVLNYYNGGLGGSGSGPGPALGITFSSNSLALIENTQAGGTGAFRNEPSKFVTMYFLTGVGAVMNVPAGFNTGFSFFYATAVPATIRVFAGLNATGTLLATLPLAANNSGVQCASAPVAFYCNFTATGVSFAGTAMSVDFGGAANGVGFDNITLNSATPSGVVIAGPAIPVPTLGQFGLMLLALLGAIGGVLAIRRAKR